MQRVTLIQIPYDSGHFKMRMGTGPDALMALGLPDTLRLQTEVESVEIRLPDGFHTEMSGLIHLQRAATAAARAALDRGSCPIFLSGNCGPAALSAVAAIGPDQAGVVWFDAHGDCNTPETSASGFLDGMCLAMLAGQCLPNVVSRLDQVKPVAGDQIIQIGLHQVDPQEKDLLGKLAITQIASDQLGQLPHALARPSFRGKRLYVHLDADVLDITEGKANSYAAPGGLTKRQLNDSMRVLARTHVIAAAAITSYD